jgi:hypothetical protein
LAPPRLNISFTRADRGANARRDGDFETDFGRFAD